MLNASPKTCQHFFTYKFLKGWDFVLDWVKRKRPSQIVFSDVNVWLPGIPTGAAPMIPGSESTTQGTSVQAKPAESGCFLRGQVFVPEVVSVTAVNTATDNTGTMETLKKTSQSSRFQVSSNYISFEIDPRDFAFSHPSFWHPRMLGGSRILSINEDSSSLPLWTVT